MRTIRTLFKNGQAFDHDENTKLTKEQEGEIISLLKSFGAIKPNEECSLVETIVCYTVHPKDN